MAMLLLEPHQSDAVGSDWCAVCTTPIDAQFGVKEFANGRIGPFWYSGARERRV
jgi:hypothetical protein